MLPNYLSQPYMRKESVDRSISHRENRQSQREHVDCARNSTTTTTTTTTPPPSALPPSVFTFLPPTVTLLQKHQRNLLTVRAAFAVLLLSLAVLWVVRTRYEILPVYFLDETTHSTGYRDISDAQQELNSHMRSSSLLARKPFGVNVIGYVMGSFGIAEASRSTAMALLETANLGYEVPISLTMQKGREWANQNDTTLMDKFGLTIDNSNPYIFSIVHDDIHDDVGEKLRGDWNYTNSYKIGVWNWELNNTPNLAHRHFRNFDEVWVPSSYCAEPFMSSAPSEIPVIMIPYVVDMDKFYHEYQQRTRSADTSGLFAHARQRFNIPTDTYVFLFQFDMFSCYERKNPFAVIHAFLRAFGPEDNVILIMKSMHATSLADMRTAWALLEKDHKGRIFFIDDELSIYESFLLKAAVDCLVSLHHSEGFGFNIAEIMYLGKPVITTAYSSNVDFMTADISYPVNFELVQIEYDTCHVYHTGSHWAKPDIVHAAELMRHVFENQEEASEVGARGSEYIRKHYNPRTIGKIMLDRLAFIYTSLLRHKDEI